TGLVPGAEVPALQWMLTPREHEVQRPLGFAQPAEASVLEGQVPLVPDAVVVVLLQVPDETEADPVVPALEPDGEGRRGLSERRELSGRVELLALTRHHRLAELTDLDPRGPDGELHRGATGRAAALLNHLWSLHADLRGPLFTTAAAALGVHACTPTLRQMRALPGLRAEISGMHPGRKRPHGPRCPGASTMVLETAAKA